MTLEPPPVSPRLYGAQSRQLPSGQCGSASRQLPQRGPAWDLLRAAGLVVFQSSSGVQPQQKTGLPVLELALLNQAANQCEVLKRSSEAWLD